MTKRTWLRVALIVLTTVWVYWPALRGGFIWDDHLDLPQNELLREPGGLLKIWTEPARLFDFYPLKASVQWLQWQLWQEQPLGYHLTNLVLHLVSAFLVWRILLKLGVELAWLGGLLFAVHPVAVESVAWMAELKNTLALPPLLLAFDAFIDFTRSGARRRLILSWLWFAVSLLCKTSGIMLPVFLLVFAWWERRRLIRRDLAAVTPFFLLSLMLGFVTLWFHGHRTVAPPEVTGLAAHVGLAGSILGFAFLKVCWPANLIPLYPLWDVDPLRFVQLLPWVALAIVVAFSWRTKGAWGRHLLLALAWFVLHLIPFLGLVPISYFAFTWFMDHLAYVSLLAVIGLAAALASAVPRVHPQRSRAAELTVVLVGFALAFPARQHARVFAHEEVFWRTTLARNPSAWLAAYNVGVLARDAGRPADAITAFEQALRINPRDESSHIALGALLPAAGRAAEGESHLRRALEIRPDSSAAWQALGDLQRTAGRVDESRQSYERALAYAPRSAILLNSLGLALCDQQQFGAAGRRFREALAIQPDYAEAHSNLGNVLWQAGLADEAIAAYQRALELKPDRPEIHANLGNVFQSLGRHVEAVAQYQAALKLAPDWPPVQERLKHSLRTLDLDRDRTASPEPE